MLRNRFVITKVKVHSVPENQPPIIRHYYPAMGEDDFLRMHDIIEERLEPYVVCRTVPLTYEQRLQENFIPNIEEHHIFASLEVQESLGLLYDVWNSNIRELKRKDSRFWNLPWYKRLFKGLN